MGKKVVNVASTGVAATLLISGHTAHKAFGMPIQLDETSNSYLKMQDEQARILREADLIIWDEAPSIHRHYLELVELLFSDVMQEKRFFFGGKTFLLGGDFRQCLPVIPRRTMAQCAGACLKSSPLWQHFKQFHLTKNMRLTTDVDQTTFADWLLQVGNGNLKTPLFQDLDHGINIKLVHSRSDLIDKVFGKTISESTMHDL